jgi:two-component system chemotaxis sensor kinase CheA
VNPLLSQFLSEARDCLEQVGERLLALEQTPDDAEVIGELFRLVHTLKGNSGLFEFPLLTRVVHVAEDVLDHVRDGLLAIDVEVIDELLSSMDFVQRLLDEIEDNGQIPERFASEAAVLMAQLSERLPVCAGDAVEAPVQGAAPPTDWLWLLRLSEACRATAFTAAQPSGALCAVRYLPEPECFFKGEDPVLMLRNLPRRLGFSIQPREAWPPLAELDVFRCNLLMDALSGASQEEVKDHFRYVPEQVAIYRLPAYALALPTGQPHDGPAVYGDFMDMARHSLAHEDRAALHTAVQALLEMVNPALWMASALRWMGRLLDVEAPLQALEVLLQAMASHETPDWQRLNTAAAAPVLQPHVQPDALPLDSANQAMCRLMLTTQRRLLDLPVQPEQWVGRLAALYNTLGNLYRALGDAQSLVQLDEAMDACRSSQSFTPLADLLDGNSPSAETISAVTPEPLDLSVVALKVQKNTTPQDEQASPDESNPGRRADDAAGDVAGNKGARVLKVPQEKIDRLMDLIGEMVVAKNTLPYLATRAENVFGSRELGREIKAQYAVINRIAEEMQDGIMEVRMLPVGAVFQRFPRLVRDVSKTLGKLVQLVVEGEDTEADKNIIESLGDPLIHILRNSLDHGIESPEVRAAAGKPEEGRISVRATQEGDRVLIEITDDGKGIDPEVVKRKAFDKGLIDEHRLDSISDAEAVMLVFAAGFSTNDVVSDLSGRGVGMDVVKTSLEKIGGQVSLTSKKGVGTRIVLTLPLSMAVSNVMIVDIHGQHFGVPMELVVEIVRIHEREIHALKNQRVAVLRGKIVPLFGAAQLLQLSTPSKANADGELAVLVTRVAGETVGIIVDGFAQTIDVILKPLEGPLAGLAGFCGTALLGDGSVLMVLDLKELF